MESRVVKYKLNTKQTAGVSKECRLAVIDWLNSGDCLKKTFHYEEGSFNLILEPFASLWLPHSFNSLVNSEITETTMLNLMKHGKAFDRNKRLPDEIIAKVISKRDLFKFYKPSVLAKKFGLSHCSE
jgi:hypothetical protein